MKVVLISPYEIGRQPFALAQPAAWLREAGFSVDCLDLAVEKLDADRLADAGLVAVHAGMHTATRIALEALPRVREMAPCAHVCVYGLYAPLNTTALHAAGAQTLLGGEVEARLLALAERLRRGESVDGGELPTVTLDKIPFRVPDRSRLPPLERYAHLELPDASTRVVGFAEASRGCKHLCRHCPVVPVYQGALRIVPVDVVMSDVRQQVRTGAQHISFGDPDFLNGPGHARRVLRAMHREFPELTYDATIKVEHLIAHAAMLPELADTGCLFVTTAVESVDDRVLEYLDKGHSAADFAVAAGLLRRAGIAMRPTFVPFTPWTTLEGYTSLLESVARLGLIESTAAVQLSIRLLVPQGSRLLSLPGFRQRLGEFDRTALGYPWEHADARVDALQQAVQALAAGADVARRSQGETFREIWALAFAALGRHPPAPPTGPADTPVPGLSEPWYCCAEPTAQQLASF